LAKTLVAWTNAATNVATFTKATPATDTDITVDATGKTIQVPRTNLLVGAYGYGALLTRYQFQSPSLKADSVPLEIEQIDTTATAPQVTMPPFQYYGDTPVQLKPGEALEADYQASSTTSNIFIGAWLTDGDAQVVTGKVIPGVRATGSTTLIAAAWTAVALTFDNQLPVGSYAIVGMVATSATGVFARVRIPQYGFHMGCIVASGAAAMRPDYFRMGRFGANSFGTYSSWGAFVSTAPPQIEFMAVAADTSEVVLFDLVKIA
jgi:hypothetical protein